MKLGFQGGATLSHTKHVSRVARTSFGEVCDLLAIGLEPAGSWGTALRAP